MDLHELQEKWDEELVDYTDFRLPEDERREIVLMGDYEMEGWAWVW